jgi:uncharacterized protein (TIGR02646 family)
MRLIKRNLYESGYQTLATESPPTTSAAAAKRWDGFKGKESLLNALLIDQYHLCCYTEVNANDHFWGYHIEHIENKSQNPKRTFDLSNLGASALSDQDLKNFKPTKKKAFGGHANKKTKSVDMALFIHCHQPDCFKFFAYLSDGNVVPANGLNTQEKLRAEYTIDHLNLNSPVLQFHRQKWHEELENAYKEARTDQITLQELIDFYVKPLNNKLNQFVTMSEQFFTSTTIVT